MTDIAPYGSWRSPITLDTLVAGVVGLQFPLSMGEDLYWLERRPEEEGRQVIVRRSPRAPGSETEASEAVTNDVIGPPFNARTLVHEYGGLPYAVSRQAVYFSNFADQRLYKVAPGTAPEPITPVPSSPRATRFAAPVISPDGAKLFAVRERHPDPDSPAEVINDVVVIETDGSSEPRVLASGHDFFSHVVLSPAGDRLAWTSWDHPNMPWDGTELWELDLREEVSEPTRRLIAGSKNESVTQPKYSPEGILHFLSDRTGWWSLYAVTSTGEDPEIEPVLEMERDIGVPDWIFGRSTYAFVAGSILVSWRERGSDRLGLLRDGKGPVEEIPTEYSDFDQMQPTDDGSSVLAVAAGPDRPTAIVKVMPPQASGESTSFEVLRLGHSTTVESQELSMPEVIEFPTVNGLSAYGFFYPPHNPAFRAPEGELPPLIVGGHGGPTSARPATLDYGVQFWTSRGIGVVDVNYGGSTGYGRAYRERLKGAWGIVDVEDSVNAARYLVSAGRADPDRLMIHGGSVGGYTTLCALTFTDIFAAGASYFGVADAGRLAAETHKFESRDLDGLIGPWPEATATYEERSPIFHTDQMSAPLILFQGLEDKVVPPRQAEMMTEALSERGIPYAYIAYEGEQHGFRKAENVKRTSEAELYFYGRVLGFTPCDKLSPVEIENVSALE